LWKEGLGIGKDWDLVSPEGRLVRGDQRGPVGVEVVYQIR